MARDFYILILSIKCSVATKFQLAISYTKKIMPIFVIWSIFNNSLIETFFGTRSMCVCMYVRMYACTYVCMCVCMYVRMYACTYVCMYGCMHVRMYVCTYVCMYVCMHVRMYVCNCNFI